MALPEGDTLELLILAEKRARVAHAGQLDKQGKPYIDHCGRVAYRCKTWRAAVIAWLHDTVEDTGVSLESLEAEGFPTWVIVGVEAVTRWPGESPEAYYAGIRADDLALDVKLADIADNCDPRRLLALPAGEMVRLMQKYAKALDALLSPL